MSELYLFPYQKVEQGSRVVIYGTGLVGTQYLNQLRANHYCEIAFITARDHNADHYAEIYGVQSLPPETLANRRDFDHIIIATANEEFQAEIVNRLQSYGIDSNKIISDITKTYTAPYGQHGEDYIIYFALKHMGFFRDGKFPTYIDVGAHHPYDISNTALFNGMGCHGINIEANPELLEEFKRERPGDINLCFGIGPEEGEFPFYKTGRNGLNTFKKENIEYNNFLVEHDTGRKSHFAVKDVELLPVRKLENVIEEYAGGKWPDFMSIDIEGMEYASLKDCNLEEGPAIIAVEVNYDGDLFVKMMSEKGYFPYIWYRENIIFIKNKYECMVHAHTER